MGKKRRESVANVSIQTTLSYSEVEEEPNGNRTFPYGLVRAVRHYLEFIGLLKFLRSLKRETCSAPRLDLIVVALIVFTLYDTNSMDACSRWLEDPQIKKILGFRRTDNISQITIDRAVKILGNNRESILEMLWKGITDRFEIDNYEVAVDGSAVIVYGPKARMGNLGHPRDGGPSDLQIEFTVAILTQLDIPIYVKPFEGNASDERQYREAIPEISGLIQGKGIRGMEEYKKQALELASVATMAKVGAMIIADNGAASSENVKRAEKCGNDMLTREKLNMSDERNIIEHCCDFEVLPDLGVMCYMHTFDSSGRTNYLYCSPDLLQASVKKGCKSIERGLRDYRYLQEHGMNRSKIVKVRKVPGYKVDLSISRDEDFDPKEFTEARILKDARRNAGIRAGFFKLSCTVQLTPEEALRRYRQRALVEQTISSLKRITGIKPLRVWGDEAVGGSMVLALLGEAVLSMARYCSKKRFRNVDKRSGKKQLSYVASTRTLALELRHLTLTRFCHIGKRFDAVLSNWTPLTEAVFADIHEHESPEWGSKKVPLIT